MVVKKLKNGEFVVLNGGAMVKTKTGATMGDKIHLGFLSVNNHFDSNKNYQSFTIIDEAPNGQFEFYACSHKCLADFFTRQIMHLSKISKYKKIEIAPQSKIEKIRYEWGNKVVSLMGFKAALITDESAVYDFIGLSQSTPDKNKKFIEKISKKLGFPVKETDYIWQLAKKFKTISQVI